jgi:hypothetical protein
MMSGTKTATLCAEGAMRFALPLGESFLPEFDPVIPASDFTHQRRLTRVVVPAAQTWVSLFAMAESQLSRSA